MKNYTQFELNLENDIIHCCQNSLEYVSRNCDPCCDERVACKFHPTSSQSYVNLKNRNMSFASIVDRAHSFGGDVMNG